jgi:DNA helicase-2/ATP-dependent DNA helicase PcrA
MEEALLRVGIPYKVVGGTRFYDRREIKDALAFLKAAVNPVDEVSVKRVLNVPKRGIGDSSIGRLDAWASAHGEPFVESLRSAPEAGVTGRAIGGIDEFISLLDHLAGLNDDGPARILESALARQLVDGGLADTARLRAISSAWRAWAASDDGWVVIPHGEIVWRKPDVAPPD